MRTIAMLGLLAWTLVFTAAPAWADFRLERQLTLAADGTLVLDTAVGSVILTGDSPSGGSIVLTDLTERC